MVIQNSSKVYCLDGFLTEKVFLTIYTHTRVSKYKNVYKKGEVVKSVPLEHYHTRCFSKRQQ